MWTPVYEYQPSYWVKLRTYFLLGLSFILFLVGIDLGDDFGGGWIVLVILSIASIYSYLCLLKPKKIRQTLRKENIEFYEYTNWKNLWFVRNNINLIGIFNKDKRIFYLPVEYSQIIIRNNYLFLEKNGKFGVVNIAIGEHIVPCEYDNISYNEQSGNIVGSKGTKRFEMSPYGSLIKEYDVRDEIGKMVDKIIVSARK